MLSYCSVRCRLRLFNVSRFGLYRVHPVHQFLWQIYSSQGSEGLM